MIRDWQKIREILEAIEQDKTRTHWQNLETDDDRRIVLLHYELLHESGLITNFSIDTDVDDNLRITPRPCFITNEPGARALRLTMQGYDMLEVLRDQALFSRLKTLARSSSVKLTCEFIKQAVPFIYKQML